MRFAIVGLGCRFPGSSNSPQEFYQNLSEGKDCVSEIPEDRWNKDFFHSDDKDEPGKMLTKRGGFMDHLFDFDHSAFKMSVKEASNIDPQQKILLEVALQTLEDANIEYRQSKTAVFVGSGQVGYAKLATSDPHMINQYTASGSSLSIQSNMISYKFDLRGPSMVVDTACSSSGTAMYLAMNSIKNGDCDQALVGGINMLLNHSMTVAFSKLGVLSPDGRCKSFDARANGYVRSEGAGFVLVKPLEAAIRDGNHIYCELVHCTANEDGALSPSLTMPSAEAQEIVMRSALEQANIDPNDVYYVEAHATGTVVGDSTEVNTIGRIFGENRENSTLRVGSVKSSIGHCECSSFMASLIKCCLMMDKKTLLPSIHFEQPNPSIHFDKYHMQVQTQVEPFEDTPGEKIFSISSFGFGGANVCCLLKTFSDVKTIELEESKAAETYPETQVFVIRAQSKDALEARIQQFKEYSEQNPQVSQRALAHTLNSANQPYRFLSYGIGTKLHEARFVPPLRVNESGKRPLCFVFSGQGPQHAMMCRQLYKQVPRFREIIDQLDVLYKEKTGISVVNDLQMFQEENICPESEVQKIQNTLPCLLFAQLALYEMWKSLGLEPDILIGHSFGELTAIYAAGSITLEDVVSITAARASLMLKLDNQGTMCALGCSAEQTNEMIEKLGLDQVWIAAYNSPVAVTVGGTHESIDALHKFASGQGIFSRKLSVTNAYHTPLLQPLRKVAYQEFSSSVSSQPKVPVVPIVSTVSASLHTEEYNTQYFWSNIEQAVRFHQGIEAVRAVYPEEEPVFLEISPHPVLGMSMKQIGCENVLGTIHRRKPELEMMYDTASKLTSFGHRINWSNFTGPQQRVRDLPTYPFQRKNCFAESVFNRDERLVPERNGNPHPLLGRRMHTVEELWMSQISSKTLDWIKDHVVQSSIIFPGAGYVEMAMQAFEQPSIKSVSIHQAMSVSDNETRLVQTKINNDQVQIFSSQDAHNWTLHSEAQLSSTADDTIPDIISLEDARQQCTKKLEHLYDRFKLLDLNYGHHFQLLDEVFEGEEQALGVFKTDHLTRLSTYYMHPSIIDNCFQCFLCCGQNLSRTYLPTNIDEIRILTPLSENPEQNVPKYVHCQLRSIDEKSLIGDAVAYNAAGSPVLYISGFQCKAMPKARGANSEKDLYTIQWQEKEVPAVEVQTQSAVPDNLNSLAQAMSHKAVSYTQEAKDYERINPAKQEWWKWCLQLLQEDMAEAQQFEDETILDTMGSQLREFLSTDQFDSVQGISLEQNPSLSQTIDFVVEQIEHMLQAGNMSSRIIRAYAAPNWLSQAFIQRLSHPNIDWIRSDEEPDTHLDMVISFGNAPKLHSSVPGQIRINIAPSADSFHYFAYPQAFGQVTAASNDSTFNCGAYSVSVEQVSETGSVENVSYDEIIIYQETDSVPLLSIVQAQDPDKKVLFILTCDSKNNVESTALVGFGRVIANEYANWDVRIIDCAQGEQTAQWVDRVKANPQMYEQEMRITEDDHIVVPRLKLIQENGDEENNLKRENGFHLHVSQPGILNTLQWHSMSSDSMEDSVLEENQVLIEVHAASLNFKDMMLAQGMLKGLESEINLGLECSGIIKKVGPAVTKYQVGDEVFGFGDRCLASHVVTSDTLIVRKPQNISHEEACSIPAVFVTSYFGLVHKAGLSEGQSVLIHSAAGGVGQASIQIAKWKQASQILATVGSQAKRDFLSEKYGITDFANSHTLNWPQEFAEQGIPAVDVVLNSLSGKHIEMGIQMLRAYGAFVEIGKRDILDNNAIHLRPFLENLSYHSVHLDRMMCTREDLVGRLLQQIADRFEAEDFRPNVDRVFNTNEVQSAFRYMQSGQHRGKIVISMKQTPEQLLPRVHLLSPHKTYFLSGGLGAVGFEMARWMYQQGARDIVLMSRSGRAKAQQKRIMEETNGAIRIAKADVCSEDDVRNMFADERNKQLGGIVHLAMCLEDDRISKLTEKRFQTVLDPKIAGAKNLINLCPDAKALDFVVFFSSISAIIGNPEQANYAAGNGFLDFYAQHLTQQDIPARVLNLGTVEDVGVIAQDYTLRRVLMTRGLLNQATCVKEICEHFMPELIKGTATQIVPEIDLKAVCEQYPSLRPVYGLLVSGFADDSGSNDGESGELTEEAFKTTISQLLQMGPEDIDMKEKLINYGVDSLLAVEISTIFSKKFGKNLSQMDILGGITGAQILNK